MARAAARFDTNWCQNRRGLSAYALSPIGDIPGRKVRILGWRVTCRRAGGPASDTHGHVTDTSRTRFRQARSGYGHYGHYGHGFSDQIHDLLSIHPRSHQIYAGFPGYSVRSAGTEDKARIKVTRCHIGWADIIICMEKKHVDRLRDKFNETLDGKRLVCLNIPDDYKYMDPELVDLLTSKLSEHIEVPE